MNYRTTLAATAITALTLGAGFAPLVASAEDSGQSEPTTMDRPEIRPMIIREKIASSTIKDMREAEEKRIKMMREASTTLPRPEAKERMKNASGTPVRVEGKRAEKMNAMLAKAQERAEKEIDRRISALEAFADRVGNVHLSDADKAALQSTMQQQIDALVALKTQIMANTSTSTLKSAVQSITKSHRIFALVVPQGAIMAAADRVNQVASQLQELSTKLSARISAAGTNGADVSALSATLTDFDAKIADATSQAQAAIAEVKALTPDNGDETILKANKAALQDAHKKLQAAQQDLQDARHDAETIVKGLKALNSTVTASSTPSTENAQ